MVKKKPTSSPKNHIPLDFEHAVDGLLQVDPSKLEKPPRRKSKKNRDKKKPAKKK